MIKENKKRKVEKMKQKHKRWEARQARKANTRGPVGHWEIGTAECDGHDVCVVQCVFSKKVAEEIVESHNKKVEVYNGFEREKSKMFGASMGIKSEKSEMLSVSFTGINGNGGRTYQVNLDCAIYYFDSMPKDWKLYAGFRSNLPDYKECHKTFAKIARKYAEAALLYAQDKSPDFCCVLYPSDFVITGKHPAVSRFEESIKHQVVCGGQVISKHRSFYLAQCAVTKHLKSGKIDNNYRIEPIKRGES